MENYEYYIYVVVVEEIRGGEIVDDYRKVSGWEELKYSEFNYGNLIGSIKNLL